MKSLVERLGAGSAFGKPLRIDLEDTGFEIMSNKLPAITADEPLRIPVRVARVNFACSDAIFYIKALNVETWEIAPRPQMRGLGVQVS